MGKLSRHGFQVFLILFMVVTTGCVELVTYFGFDTGDIDPDHSTFYPDDTIGNAQPNFVFAPRYDRNGTYLFFTNNIDIGDWGAVTPKYNEVSAQLVTLGTTDREDWYVSITTLLRAHKLKVFAGLPGGKRVHVRIRKREYIDKDVKMNVKIYDAEINTNGLDPKKYHAVFIRDVNFALSKYGWTSGDIAINFENVANYDKLSFGFSVIKE